MDRQIPSSLLMFISYRAAEDRIFAAVAEAFRVVREEGRCAVLDMWVPSL